MHMEYSIGDLLMSGPVRDILCYHNISNDVFWGPDPPYHRHDGYEIYFFIQGHTRMYVEQSCYQMSAGDCILVKPGQLHRCIIEDTETYERIGINITGEALAMLSSRSTNLLACFHAYAGGEGSGIIHLSAYDMDRYIKLVDRYLKSSRSNEYGSDLRSIYYFTELLVLINDLFRDPKVRIYDNVMPEIVSNTMKYVAEHLTEEISLADIGAALNYSGRYISLQMKRHTGLSLREYVFDQKIECAKRLLAQGGSVSDACYAAGFHDYANFLRSFKKKTGTSPGRYKKELPVN